MGKKEVTSMYIALPIIGGLIGLFTFGVAMLSETINFSPLLTAVLLLIVMTGLTGGLHLDGFADTGDAYFSYRDLKKRHEILNDPRIGAFGTMAMVFLLLLKAALLYEFLSGNASGFAVFIAIPLLARAGMNVYFALTPLSKEEGIAHFFKTKMNGRIVNLGSSLIGLATLIATIFALSTILLPIVWFVVLVLGVLLFNRWSLKHFGGVTGDLCGAFIEGMEAVLWIVVIVCM
ncbi:adenosylcobinamide-GDP ribazoletransferase [Sporosarcina sp. USHLN248]|uniref:adenosylcobinamide-GDP ribazoletransferase n=1 Tax=Sporosarcina sp. USHLN248 TaxID=3081300 RepID=UPI00301B68DD